VGEAAGLALAFAALGAALAAALGLTAAVGLALTAAEADGAADVDGGAGWLAEAGAATGAGPLPHAARRMMVRNAAEREAFNPGGPPVVMC